MKTERVVHKGLQEKATTTVQERPLPDINGVSSQLLIYFRPFIGVKINPSRTGRCPSCCGVIPGNLLMICHQCSSDPGNLRATAEKHSGKNCCACCSGREKTHVVVAWKNDKTIGGSFWRRWVFQFRGICWKVRSWCSFFERSSTLRYSGKNFRTQGNYSIEFQQKNARNWREECYVVVIESNCQLDERQS